MWVGVWKKVFRHWPHCRDCGRERLTKRIFSNMDSGILYITQINNDGAGIELSDWGAKAIGKINLAKGVVRPWRIGYRIWRLNINLFWKTDSAGILGPVGYLLAAFIQSSLSILGFAYL